MTYPQLDVHDSWPPLPFDEWQETQETLHRWLQIVGKVKLKLTPFLNEWWNVALSVTAHGLTTGPMAAGARVFCVDLDFCDHLLYVKDDRGHSVAIPLYARSVANFYAELMETLEALGIAVEINPVPVEIPDPVRLDADYVHASYDPDAAQRWWRVLLQMDLVLQQFRSGFVGKSSPVHFFWGSFDLTTTRFSGRPASPPEGVPRFVQLAETQENYSCGFWPGNTSLSGVTLGEPAVYAYIYPEPVGFRDESVQVRPQYARYDTGLGQYLLPYEQVRLAPDPALVIHDFLESTYEAATKCASWNRSMLDLAPSRMHARIKDIGAFEKTERAVS